MATLIKPPIYDEYSNPSIFLAGSIDMGSAVDWQTQVYEALKDEQVTIFNPRRDDWDSSWEQSINNPKFKEQVVWELEHLESADLVVFYFDVNGPAPITLLELGLFAVDIEQHSVVCCPEGYWRKGNVDIVCERYGINQVKDLSELITFIKEWIHELR